MGIITPVNPRLLKAILELDGFRVIEEDDMKWTLANNPSADPVIIPKSGNEVSIEVMEHALAAAGLSNDEYFALRSE